MAVVQVPEADASSKSTPSLPGWLKRLGRGILSWVRTCSDYYAAAALYNEMLGLSDAELKRRGLSRGTLARDICSDCDPERVNDHPLPKNSPPPHRPSSSG